MKKSTRREHHLICFHSSLSIWSVRKCARDPVSASICTATLFFSFYFFSSLSLSLSLFLSLSLSLSRLADDDRLSSYSLSLSASYLAFPLSVVFVLSFGLPTRSSARAPPPPSSLLPSPPPPPPPPPPHHHHHLFIIVIFYLGACTPATPADTHVRKRAQNERKLQRTQKHKHTHTHTHKHTPQKHTYLFIVTGEQKRTG